MRAALLAAVLLLLAGCGGFHPPTREVAGTASPEAPATRGDQAGYLIELQGKSLLGSYSDSELVTLGLALCDYHETGGNDPLSGGIANGDGTVHFDGVNAPVWAVDMISVDFAAQEYLCPV